MFPGKLGSEGGSPKDPKPIPWFGLSTLRKILASGRNCAAGAKGFPLESETVTDAVPARF
jgi:hypothetical protein